MPRSVATRSHGQRKKRSQPTSIPTPKPPVQPVNPPKRWLWLIVLVAAIMLVSFGIWHVVSGPSSATTISTTTSTSLPASTPTPKRSWHTLLTFSGGNGTKNTQKFKMPADWQFTWSCKGVNGVDGGLFVVIYNANGSLYNAGAQITCLASKQVIGSAEEFKSGNVYLNINGNVPWTVSVQNPQ